jgi:hypothetical protein
MRRVLFVLVLAGCGGSDPYCSEFVDITGRPAAFCPDSRQDPVCDYAGQRAHFEERDMALELVGGERATCTVELEVVCPMGTVGEPYCITDPEL